MYTACISPQVLAQPILIILVFQHAATVDSLVEQSGEATGGMPMQILKDLLDQKTQRSCKGLSGIVLVVIHLEMQSIAMAM